MNKETDENTNGPQPHDGVKETANAPDQAREADQIIHESINFPDNQDDSKYNRLLNMTVEEFSKLSIEGQKELVNSYIEANKELKASIGRIAKQIADLYGTGIFQELDKKKKALQPYLRKELEKPEYNGATPEDVFAYYNPFTGEPFSIGASSVISEQPPEWWMEKHKITGQQALKAMEAAKAAKEAAEKINIKRANDVTYPVDKPNSNIWNLADGISAVQFDMTAKKDNKSPVMALYSITFTDDNILKEANMSKRLSPFDKLVYMAVWSSAKMNQHSSYYVTTLSQIYYTMGNTSKPSHDQLARIYDSMRKMRSANVTLNNQQEHERYKNIPPSSLLDAPLLPFEASSMYTNGKLTDTGIVLYREPPLITFARQRKQLSAVPIKYMQIPLNRTDENIAIDDYLKVRILREANKRETNKHTRDFRIIYETLFEKCGITERRSKSRTKNKIKALLDFYKKNSFIENYTVQSDGVKITLQSKKRT